MYEYKSQMYSFPTYSISPDAMIQQNYSYIFYLIHWTVQMNYKKYHISFPPPVSCLCSNILLKNDKFVNKIIKVHCTSYLRSSTSSFWAIKSGSSVELSISLKAKSKFAILTVKHQRYYELILWKFER